MATSQAAPIPTHVFQAEIRCSLARRLYDEAALIAEFVLTEMFLRIIMGAMAGILVTNLSVNPARSTSPIFVGGWAIKQLWLFWFAPIADAIAGARSSYRHHPQTATGVSALFY